MNTTPTLADKKPKKFKMHPKLLGGMYIALGIVGLVFAGYSIIDNLLDIVPLFGTAMSGAFVGILSIFVIVYGYRVTNKDYTPFI
jgi:polyferredoxin